MTLTYYLALAYPIDLKMSGDGRWMAQIPLLPDCNAEGRTRIEALENLEVAKARCFRDARDKGIEIPRPGRYCEC